MQTNYYKHNNCRHVNTNCISEKKNLFLLGRGDDTVVMFLKGGPCLLEVVDEIFTGEIISCPRFDSR